MAGFEAFDRELRLATAELEPVEIGRAVADYARAELARALADGASPNYQLFVNGREARSEYEFEPPGAIVYEFALWEPVISFALERLRQRSPVRTGRFRASFVVLVGQTIVTDYDQIPGRSEVIITNVQPYVRKAEAGLLGTKRFAIFDGTKRDLARQFGNEGRNSAAFRFETKWLDISPGVAPGLPYILKNSQGNRKDRQAGMPISYPSVVMNMVF